MFCPFPIYEAVSKVILVRLFLMSVSEGNPLPLGEDLSLTNLLNAQL